MKKGTVVRCTGIGCRPGYAEALAVCMSAGIAHPERTAALENQARERALSTFGYIRMLEEHAHKFIGEPYRSPEFQICLEANVFSKNSRVIEAL